MKPLSFFHLPLSTERLLLRPFEKKDAPTLFQMNSDPEVLRLTTWKPVQSLSEMERWIDSVHSDQYEEYGYGRLAVTLRDSGELIGWSGIKFVPQIDSPTLGYRFLKQHWGKGYATEAAKVSLLHAFHTIGLEDVHAFIVSGNEASKRVLLKNGFKSSGLNLAMTPTTLRFSTYKQVDRSHQQQPICTSERLAFYEITEADAGVMYALNSDKEVVQYTGDDSFESISAAQNFLAAKEKQNREVGFGRWKVLIRATGECIGWAGLRFDADKNETDVGYRFFRRHWGKGYATEAAKACIDYGFSTLKLERIVAHARKENVASVRVLEKCGMKIIGEALECGGEIFVFRKNRGE